MELSRDTVLALKLPDSTDPAPYGFVTEQAVAYPVAAGIPALGPTVGLPGRYQAP